MMKLKKYSLLLTMTLLMATFAAVASVTIVAPGSAQGDDWPMFGHDPRHTQHSASAAPDMMIIGWKYQTGASVRSSPAIVNGRVYIGSDDFYVYCLDGGSGSLIWRYKTGYPVMSSPAVVNAKVYVGSTDGAMYCLDAGTGTQTWKYQTGSFVYGSPTVLNGKVYFQSNDAKIYCLDATTGNKIWNYTTLGAEYDRGTKDYDLPVSRVMNAPAVADGRLYIGMPDCYVYCLNATTGAFIWKHLTDHQIYDSSPCIPGNGRVYIGSDDSYLYCLNATTGARFWRYRLPGTEMQMWVQSTPGYADGKIYIGMYCTTVCLDAITGVPEWLGHMGMAVKSSLAIAGGNVFIGCQDRYIYNFEQSTGTRKQALGLLASIDSSCAVADGNVYVGGWDRYVYCFVDGTPTVISCWASPTAVSLGQPVYVRGAIFPAVSGATVTLTYKLPKSSDFFTRTVTTSSDGGYEDVYTPNATGRFGCTAWWPGDGKYGQAWSISANTNEAFWDVIEGKGSSSISVSVSPTSIKLGSAVTVSGSISPAVVGATVVLTYTKPDATTLTRTVISGTGGSLTDTYTPNAIGDWSVKSSWVGDPTTNGATSTAAQITVTEEEAPSNGSTTTGISMEVIYGVVAVVVIAIVVVAAYLFMKRKK